jgi:hypothetical protein
MTLVQERRLDMERIRTLALAGMVGLLGSGAQADTDLDAALANGGTQLNSDQIADLLIGSVVTAKAGEKMFRFFYDPSNVVSGELTNGGWSGTGAFAVTDADSVCVSMAADKGRYRCLTVVQVGDRVMKFDTKGKMTFELLGFEPSTGL